ncbi:unnamed protein product [Vicia faba]|uniref:Pentatricopeptide repeat-containing protein n=1 Tax=Vicia faba TaxID=3906 RepID=A0AAV1ATN2_VICFA|nr:unnamed protein product [Vicia faba]
MIQGFYGKGLFYEVMTLLSKMKDNSYIPDAVTYEIVIHSLFDKDGNDKAEKFLPEMIARATESLQLLWRWVPELVIYGIGAISGYQGQIFVAVSCCAGAAVDYVFVYFAGWKCRPRAVAARPADGVLC